ncbi:MAG TPA: CHRD domain-containing protein, partial [Cryomorphaceae bacterium]|nr:CHRD domain-containing protein [Cryomorphaceae bacterium]
HFHNGAFGVNGDVLINLTDDVEGNQISGFFTGTGLNLENINKFLSGGIYLNIHTDMNPAGEIRGQVYKLAREGYTYKLSGDQEVPMVDTDAYGSGIASIDRDQSNVHFMMAYNDLSGPQAMAHFHMASEGENGDVIFNLSPFFDQTDNFDAAFGYWTDADATPFDANAAMAFREEMVYVNVHTSENPGGELRGQVSRDLICSSFVSGLFEQFERKSLSIYPNPTNEGVNIEVSSLPAGQYNLNIVDITGKTIDSRIVRTGEANIIRYENERLVPGIYFLSINGENAVYTAKLIKN